MLCTKTSKWTLSEGFHQSTITVGFLNAWYALENSSQQWSAPWEQTLLQCIRPHVLSFAESCSEKPGCAGVAHVFFLTVASVKGAPRPSMLALLHNILTQEGVAGLYRGISPNLLKVIPAVSVSYVVYEYTRIVLGVDIEGRKGGKGKG